MPAEVIKAQCDWIVKCLFKLYKLSQSDGYNIDPVRKAYFREFGKQVLIVHRSQLFQWQLGPTLLLVVDSE